jgi:hypothetical protein
VPVRSPISVSSLQIKHVLEHKKDNQGETPWRHPDHCCRQFHRQDLRLGSRLEIRTVEFFKTRGRNGRTIIIVTIYQVCNQAVASAGSTTACIQQHTLLDEASRIKISASGVPYPHPRKALIQDFSEQLRSWRETGHEFIISGDLNEMLGDNPAEFGSITTEFNLVDVYRHRHGMDEPAMFNGGNRRLNYILCSTPLLSTVTTCGILPFNILSHI